MSILSQKISFIKRPISRFVFSFLSVLLFANQALALTPNDPYFSEQWYLDKISAPLAWDHGTGSQDVIVAVLDTGIDVNHVDISQNIWQNTDEIPYDRIDNDNNGYIDDTGGWNFIENDNNVRPRYTGLFSTSGVTHGTLISGIIAAVGNNNEGVAGLSWQTKIMPVRVLDDLGEGDSDDIVAGIDYAIRNGADIINLSFTTFDRLPTINEAIRRAKDAGIIVVAAAGNDSGVNTDLTPVYPICSDGPAGENWVLGVASVDRYDKKSSFSNYGSLCVDVSAPGEKIFGAQPTDLAIPTSKLYGGNWSGTSLATPIVSGVAALIKAVAPNLSRSQVIDIIARTATPIDSLNPDYRGRLGFGRVNANDAIILALQKQSQTPNVRFAVSSDSGKPRVWLFDGNGTLITAFLAYGESFTGGVRIALGDVDGDGAKEIITGAGPGGGPHVRIFDDTGKIESQFFAFTTQFRGGVTVSSGDINNDGKDEIIVGSGRGGSPIVKIFNNTGTVIGQFLAYSSSFTNGIEVSVGDVDGDGTKEIITAAGPGGGPHVRAFNSSGQLKGQFFAFENSYRGGVRIASGDTDNDRKDEIIATRGSSQSSEIKVFSINGTVKSSFNAYAPDRRTVLAPSTLDRDSDSKDEIVVASNNISPELRGFSQIGALVTSFMLPKELQGNLRLASF